METAIKVKYSDVEITYIEKKNVWNFELRGRERNCESLEKAKDAIDKPETEKREPFVRVRGYLRDRWGNQWVEPVEVTSLADSAYQECWVVGKDGRKKVSCRSVIEVCAENDKKIEELVALTVEIKRLEDKKSKLDDSLKIIKFKELQPIK